MKITSITYRAVVTPSEYQGGAGMTRTMEATAELGEGVCPDLEMEQLVDHVHGALGKPTMAEARARRLLAEVDALWIKSYAERQSAERERASAARNRDLSTKAPEKDYAGRCLISAEEAEKNAAAHVEKAARLQTQAEKREAEGEVGRARRLLSRPKPEPGEDPNTDDDIPF